MDMKFGKLIGAIDEGTSSARFIIFKAGTDEIVCMHQVTVESSYPREGWVEQSPTAIYDAVYVCIEEAVSKLKDLGGNPKDIVAIGVTNQRESVIVWDRRTGRPLHNAIIWLDNRTSSTVDKLLDGIPEEVRSKSYLQKRCGLPLSPYFSALKLRWLYDNDTKIAKTMEEGNCLVGNVDSWLIYILTGGPRNGGIHVTDVTNASRTMLMNINTLQWDDELIKFFGLPKKILPKIRSSAERYGYVKIGSLTGVEITACLGDQQAALVGQRCLQRGLCKSTFGTGAFLLCNTGNSVVYSDHGLLTTVAYQFGADSKPVYALEGSVAIAGAALSWLRDNLGLFSSTQQVEQMARMVDNVLDVYFVPAFNGLYAPYWDQNARGVICGLSEETTSEHIVRATLEAVSFQVHDILDAMKKDFGYPIAKLMVDGGMTVNTLFLQLQSDLLGIDVIRSRIAETTALGAALAAYKAIEPSFNIDNDLNQFDSTLLYKPLISSSDRESRYKKWKMAVDRSLAWESAEDLED
ncbi:glycerol kinase [Teleopsis dalmanni]|uniref:glycerol kinase n=1 Tax=Teleopsis dalmanni TaxID=139649 RepID=UPI000D32B930|nr:glycerol kinase [Teleopsis dalmanni]